jgi:hypothetical protein
VAKVWPPHLSEQTALGDPAPEAKYGERKASTRMNKTGVGDGDPSVMESDELEL